MLFLAMWICPGAAKPLRSFALWEPFNFNPKSALSLSVSGSPVFKILTSEVLTSFFKNSK